MSDIVEIAARAAFERNREIQNPIIDDPRYQLEAWENEPERLREDWREYIKAALKAINVIA